MVDFNLDTSKLDALGDSEQAAEAARVAEFAEEAQRYCKSQERRQGMNWLLDNVVGPAVSIVVMTALAAIMVAAAWWVWTYVLGG